MTESDMTRLGCYIQCLCEPIQQLIDLQNITQFSLVYQAALKVEAMLAAAPNPLLPVGHLTDACPTKGKHYSLFTDCDEEEDPTEHVAAFVDDIPTVEISGDFDYGSAVEEL
ncbi:hypothetical protein FRX31_003036 [Thalictrum thalictroides]|uniref:Uncharacterized protein n=1 Tax=Thalictrum thalictroides TaxID=46969 RepID=A0A7J6XC63_THATH|nr:hypothetical protein FRX31_003036 [Thalictrum thalictroides]